MNHNSRLRKLENQFDPTILTWVDLMRYDGTGPFIISVDMADLIKKAKQ